MAEFSKGKQSTKNPGPSRLRYVQQVPDSDAVIPETQLEADEYGLNEGIDLADLAFVEKNSVRRSGNATSSSRPFPSLPQTFGIAKPSSVFALEPAPSFGFARRPPNKTSPKEDAPALQLPVHPDTAIPSVEHDDNEAPKQDNNITPAASPTWPSPTIEEHVTMKTLRKDGAPPVSDKLQESSHTNATSVNALDTEPAKSGLSRAITDTQTMSKPAVRSPPVVKKNRSGTKAKKGKKLLHSRRLVPWPPRQGPVPGDTDIPSIAESPTNHTSTKHKAGTSALDYGVEDLAVKTQHGVQIDGPCDTEEQLFRAETALPGDAIDDTYTSDEHLGENTSHVDQAEATQFYVHFDAAVQRPIIISDPSNIPDGLSPYDLHEGHNHVSQMQQASHIEMQTPGGPPFVSKVTGLPPRGDPKPHPTLKPVSRQRAKDAEQQPSSSTLTTNVESVCSPSSRLEDPQHHLRGAFSHPGSIRVTKAWRKIRPIQANPRASVATEGSQAPLRMTTLDIALNSIRTVCLADQNRMRDQMDLTVSNLKEDKKHLQSTTLEQQATIAELRIRLKTSEDCFARLTEKAKKTQRYVAGLQKDYEQMRKSIDSLQKENKQALQDQIAEVVKEKATLEDAYGSAIDSFTKARKAMLKTLKETYTQYVITLSRVKDLEDRLNEQARIYEEEKNRRIELEQQLLPSVQSIQHQLNEGSAALIDRLSSLHATLESRVTEDGNDCSIQECMKILQKLEAMPLLTTNDVRKAEGMLRFILERTDTGFEFLAKTSESEPLIIEGMRQCMRDQIQGLQAEILRHDQAIVDGHLAHKTSESLNMELNTQNQHKERLEQQANILRQSEAALKSRVTRLEKERDELQAAVREHETQPRESELKVMQLQDQLSRSRDGLLLANDKVKQHERLRLEHEQEFCKYRVNAMAHLVSLKEQKQQMTDQIQTTERENNALQQDVADLKIKLESAQTKHDQLTVEASQYKSTADTLRQEKGCAIEKQDAAQASLQSAKETKFHLEREREELSVTLEEIRTRLSESKGAETRLTAQCFDLQRQLGELQDAKNASDKQLQQAQHDVAIKLQQAKTDYTTELDDLRSRLSLSENAREESQAKIRQMEAALKQQIESHKQKANARFENLISESQREQEKLKANHSQQLQIRVQEATTNASEMFHDAQKRSREAGVTTSKTLVPNTQQSVERCEPPASSHLSQTGRTRRKVDRQTNSVMVVVPSSSRRPNSDERGSATDRPGFPHSRREGSEHQPGYFDEEFHNRFGSQVPLHEQEAQFSLVDPNAEVVPETQDFEFTQGFTAQFDVIESQVSASGNLNQKEALSDLSTMPSEDLSEMLLDVQSSPRRGRTSSGHLLSPTDMMHMPERSAHDLTSDAASTHSQSRPKSRANTASRMMPLPVQDVHQQHVQAHGSTQQLVYARSDRSFRAENNDSPDFMHANNAASKRTYAQRASVPGDTPADGTDSGQKRSAPSSHAEQDEPLKKLRTSAQCFSQCPSSISKSYAPYTPAPTGTMSNTDVDLSLSSATGRRSSNRQSSIVGSQVGTPRLSSTRNTRSKTNRYADRFGQELDRR